MTKEPERRIVRTIRRNKFPDIAIEARIDGKRVVRSLHPKLGPFPLVIWGLDRVAFEREVIFGNPLEIRTYSEGRFNGHEMDFLCYRPRETNIFERMAEHLGIHLGDMQEKVGKLTLPVGFEGTERVDVSGDNRLVEMFRLAPGYTILPNLSGYPSVYLDEDHIGMFAPDVEASVNGTSTINDYYQFGLTREEILKVQAMMFEDFRKIYDSLRSLGNTDKRGNVIKITGKKDKKK